MPEAREDELIITKSPGLIDEGPGLEVSILIFNLCFFNFCEIINVVENEGKHSRCKTLTGGQESN